MSQFRSMTEWEQTKEWVYFTYIDLRTYFGSLRRMYRKEGIFADTKSRTKPRGNHDS